MALQLKANTLYRTRDGGFIGPLVISWHHIFRWRLADTLKMWRDDGTYGLNALVPHQYDIVEEVGIESEVDQEVCF